MYLCVILLVFSGIFVIATTEQGHDLDEIDFDSGAPDRIIVKKLGLFDAGENDVIWTFEEEGSDGITKNDLLLKYMDTKLTVDSKTGNVGIGVHPDSGLTIAANRGLHLLGQNKIHFTDTKGQIYIGSPSSDKMVFGMNGNNHMIMRKVGSGDDEDKIKTSIGSTDTPSGLYVKYPSNLDYAMFIYNPGVSGRGLKIKGTSGSDIPLLQVVNNYEGNPCDTGTSSQKTSCNRKKELNPLFRIEGNGNIGLGTSNPQQKLDVRGIIRIGSEGGRIYGHTRGDGGKELILTIRDGQGNNKDRIWIGPNVAGGSANNLGEIRLRSKSVVHTGSLSSSSDVNLKKDIETVPNALDRVSQLRGVNFRWKNGEDLQMGVIAQEVENVFPELVSSTEDGKTVSYTQLTGALIEAVKELKDEVDTLKVENEALKAKIN